MLVYAILALLFAFEVCSNRDDCEGDALNDTLRAVLCNHRAGRRVETDLKRVVDIKTHGALGGHRENHHLVSSTASLTSITAQALHDLHQSALLETEEVNEPKPTTPPGPKPGQRPGEDKNEPDIVEVGIMVKNSFGVTPGSGGDGIWALDMIEILMWKDPVAANRLILEGKDYVETDDAHARGSLWVPDIVCTNRVPGTYDVISSNIRIDKSGQVTKTLRAMVSVRINMDLSAFPFDNQVLRVSLGSSKSLKDTLQLRATEDKDLFGPNPHIFNFSDWTIGSFYIEDYEDVVGPLEKSRVQLILVVRRDSDPFVHSIIGSEFFVWLLMVVGIFLPTHQDFGSVRLLLGITLMVSMVGFKARTATFLPRERTGFTWIELWEDTLTCQFVAFLGMAGFVEVIWHTWKMEEFAKEHYFYCKILWFTTAFVTFLVCMWKMDGTYINSMVNVNRSLTFLCFLGSYGFAHLRKQELAKMLAQAELADETLPNVATGRLSLVDDDASKGRSSLVDADASKGRSSLLEADASKENQRGEPGTSEDQAPAWQVGADTAMSNTQSWQARAEAPESYEPTQTSWGQPTAEPTWNNEQTPSWQSRSEAGGSDVQTASWATQR